MLYESEIKVMRFLWKGEIKAGELTELCKAEYSWNPNTTYTIVKKCVKKGYVERREPGFWCKAKLQKSEAQRDAVEEVINKFFDGSLKSFFKFLELSNERGSDHEA